MEGCISAQLDVALTDIMGPLPAGHKVATAFSTFAYLRFVALQSCRHLWQLQRATKEKNKQFA